MVLRRDWSDAREKIDGQPCRVCGERFHVEAAHVIGRSRDQRQRGAGVVYVHPDSVVPLCGPATSTRSCHGRYDSNSGFDLLPYLSLDEQVQAVRDAGGLALAMRRICGREEMAA